MREDVLLLTPHGPERTRLVPGDELVINLRTSAFWFWRPAAFHLWHKNIGVRVCGTTPIRQFLDVGKFDEAAEDFGRWITRGGDPLVLIEETHCGLLSMHTLRWEEFRGHLRHAPRRMRFRAYAQVSPITSVG